MPIKGLTEKVRLPRLGKIRLGIKVQGDKNPYPKAVDYFVCPPEVQTLYGEQPKELQVMFPTEEPEQWASQFYRCYSNARGLICKGDGENAMALVDIETGEIAGRDSKTTELREVNCNPVTCKKLEAGACKPVMNLQFMLPDVPGLGIWQLDTSSINSIRNINSAVRMIKGVCGRISMIPLTLKVDPQEVQVEGKKKKIYVLQLATHNTMIDIINKLQSLPPGRALLPQPDLEPPDDLFPTVIIEDNPIPVILSPEPAKLYPEQEQETTTSPIDMAWLAEQMKILQGKKLKAWSNANIVSYLNSITGKKANSVTEAVCNLSAEQAAQFVKRVAETVAMA